jgi:tellurite resistance-related uncharacterized protein
MDALFDLALPDGVELVRITPTFDESSVPEGLRAAHQVADGVWGRLVVTSGSVGFTFDDRPELIRSVEVGEVQVIPPGRLHRLVVEGPVALAVEFHR